MASNSEGDIRDFWQENPCGENLTGKLDDWTLHFQNYDRFRYSTEGHILDELDSIDFQGQEVLEIGIGQAADSLQIAKRGGNWNGLDLTDAAILRAKTRFDLAAQSYGEVKKGSGTQIPWPENSFDIVYSHGVLHHIPDVNSISLEISRVLKPGGRLVIMMYHKKSLNYYLSILLIRRLGLLAIFFLNFLKLYRPNINSVLGGHIANAKKIGLWKYLNKEVFLHHNTDGPDNPYAKVYTEELIKDDFPQFGLRKTTVHFLNERHFPGARMLPVALYRYLSNKFGWHLWAYLTNDKDN
jgi:ubiquinone/menaquinone biosynthesis C-methylase UbiE